MTLNIIHSGGFTIIQVDGHLNTLNAADFETQVMGLIDRGDMKLIIDCSKLSYISSSGLRLFLLAQKKLQANKGLLKLCCLQPSIHEIFDMSWFTQIFLIETTLKASLTS
ncbi:MAG: STAS domain-containing protein [Bacteroidetes bacterium]|nr:STAS domain-containing protein [Bacteroidota bacterium]